VTIPGIYFRRFKKPRGRALANSGSLFFFFLSPPCPPRVNQASTERKASVHLKDITLKHTVCTEENPNPQLSRKPLSFTPCVATVKAQPQEELQHPMSRHQASLGGLSPQGRLGSALGVRGRRGPETVETGTTTSGPSHREGVKARGGGKRWRKA